MQLTDMPGEEAASMMEAGPDAGLPGRVRSFVTAHREPLYLIMLLFTLLLLFNRLTYSPHRWTLHPDDQNLFTYSHVLLHTGRLYHQSELNEEFNTTAFIPGINDYRTDIPGGYQRSTLYTPGGFFVVCLGHLFGMRGPFIIVSLLGLAGVIFIYLIARSLYGVGAAMASAAFLGFSAAYAFWSNMLFSNMSALAIFLGGAFFLYRAFRKDGGRPSYLIGSLLLGLSVWVRYEYIIFVVILVLVAGLASWRTLKLRLVVESLVAVALLAVVIVGLNTITKGSYSGVSYLEPMGGTSTGQAQHMLWRYPLTVFRSRAPAIIYGNAHMYIYSVAPVLTVAGLLGGLLLFKRKRDGFELAFLVIMVVALLYFGQNTKYWGYGSNVLASSYTRYFLIIFAGLSLFAGLFSRELVRKRAGGVLAPILVGLILAMHIFTSTGVLATRSFGLAYTNVYNSQRKQVDALAASLPEDALLVDFTRDGWCRDMIISRTMLETRRLPSGEREPELARILKQALDADMPVYMFYSTERKLMDIDEFQMKYGFRVTEIPTELYFRIAGRTPLLLEVEAVD